MLASHLQPLRGEEDPTGIALMAEAIYGGKGFLFWVTQLATFAVLILAANTAYQGFPGLSSIIARDGYMPRQLANRGDKLVFSNGVIFLAVAAGILIAVFKGNISALIPLYAFGVFTGFTLSQAGMVRHHLRLKEPHWKGSLAINAVGCVATAIVALVVVVSKFTEGAWIPAVLIPAMVVGFRAVSKHYTRVREAVQVPDGEGYTPLRRTHLVVVLVGTVHRGVIEAVRYAKSLAPERLIAVSVVTDARRAGAAVQVVDRVRHADRAAHDRLAVPRADAAGPRVPRRARRREPRRRDHRRDPRVRHAVEDAVAAQPVGVRPQGPPALSAEHRRHVGPGDHRRRRGRHDDAVARQVGRAEWRRCSSGSRTRSPSPTRASSTCALGDRVKATVDLPGIAEGTEGKVILANGFNWQRYRVRFPDGTELGDLDQRNIAPIGRAAKRVAKAAAKAR